MQAATRVCPFTVVGSSRLRSTVAPLKPNSLMDSATTGIAFSLWRALRG